MEVPEGQETLRYHGAFQTLKTGDLNTGEPHLEQK
jgi:hypothetical protein